MSRGINADLTAEVEWQKKYKYPPKTPTTRDLAEPCWGCLAAIKKGTKSEDACRSHHSNLSINDLLTFTFTTPPTPKAGRIRPILASVLTA